MKLDTKQNVLATLRKSYAYDGDGKIESVIAFLEKEEIGVDAEQLKKLWAKKLTLEVEASDSEVETVEVEAVDAPKAKALSEETQTKKAEFVKAQTKGAYGARSSELSFARKAYNVKSNAGQTRFDDADKMEAFNAAYRIYVSKVLPEFENYSQKSNDEEIVRSSGKAGSELINTLGGALVGDVLSPKLIYATEKYGVAMRVANIVDMTGGNYIHARKTGIASFNHVGMGSSATAGDNEFDNVQLTPKQIMCLVKTHLGLMENAAINVGDDIASGMLEAYHNRIDDDYFLGDTSATYGGHTGLANGLVAAANLTSTSTTWAAATAADFLQCPGKVANVDASRLCWITSRQAFYNTALRISLALSGTGAADLLNARYVNKSETGYDAELLGFPVHFCQRLPLASASATKYAYFGDFMGGSMIGVRKKLEVMTSADAGFDAAQIWTRGRAEIAVNIHGDGKSGSVGPIVSLATN